MKSRKLLLNIGAVLGGIPLVLCIPYILRAWQSSPMDHRDFVFAIAFGMAALAALLFTGHSEPVFQKRILLAALSLLCGFLFCNNIISLNAGAIVCAIMFWWVVIWLLRGIRLAFNLLPAFLILLLLVVSSTYWICVMTNVSPINAFRLKLLAMVFLLVSETLILWYNWLPKIGVILFSMAMTVAVVVMLMLSNLTKTYAPCKVSFQPMTGGYLGIELDASEGFRRFFSRSEAHQYKYSGDAADFTLLAVDCGSNIHEIHPASHCLRTSGWTIDSEESRVVVIDEKELNVTEVKATRRQSQILLWVWYSNDVLSTGNFICFRRLWRDGRQWSTYQLGVMGGHDLEESRRQLADLLASIRFRPQPQRLD